jgi:hypothetical protein
MSSWIIAKSRQTKKKPSATKYHDTASSQDVFTMYMSFIGAYIYSQKMGESCNVLDASSLLKTTLKSNPQVKYLKETSEEAVVLGNKDYAGFVSQMGFKDIKKVAGSLISYDLSLNQTVLRYLEKVGIRSMFDIAIQLNKDPAGPDLGLLKRYTALIKAYQTKAKKDTINLYIMSDNYSAVSHFQTYCDPSWKVTSMSKTPFKETDDAFVRAMAEVQIMTAVPALILDFERPVDRFIYLMQRNAKLDYFVEMNGIEWSLL